MPEETPRRTLVSQVDAELHALTAELDRLGTISAEHFGLNRTDMRCLELLRNRRPMTPTGLADALGLTTGGVTTVIDRLERSGFARRHPDPDDRRKVVVERTEAAAQRDVQLLGPLQEETFGVIDRYEDEQ